jgi:uridine phosphorylase
MIAESEFILNPDGSIYHLAIRPEELAETIITVGDPDRVERVSRHFDRVDVVRQKREFVTHTGELNGQRITVLSTGIGTDNIDIVFNELDALVNVDFATRTIRPDHRALRVVRIGTSGALQPDLPVGTLLASHHGVGLDTLMQFYPLVMSADEAAVAAATQTALRLDFRPYCVAGAASLRHLIVGTDGAVVEGNTLTCPGFYGPQGRTIRQVGRDAGLVQRFADFRLGDFRFTNFEMETAGLYSLGRLLGHNVLSLSALVANRATGHFHPNPDAPVDALIERTLSRLTA